MKVAIVQFPGSNCDQDCLAALRGIEGVEADYVWHKETSLRGWDAIVLPGGFSSAIICAAARSLVFADNAIGDRGSGVRQACHWDLQWVSDSLRSRFAPGALVRNRSLHFVCQMVTTRVEVADSPFTRGCPLGTLLRLPVAHGEGCYYADEGR